MDFDAKYDRRPASRVALDREILETVGRSIDSSGLVAVSELGGGFSSTNLRLDFASGERCVLRLAREPQRLATEADLLGFVARELPDVPVPAVLWRAPGPVAGDIAAYAMTFVEGELLCIVEDRIGERENRDLCEQAARIAARIHGVRFETTGFLGPGVKVIQSFGDRPFLEICLADTAVRTRLGAERLQRLATLVEQFPEAQPNLCHADFNQKNLLVQRDTRGRHHIAAVLDWEFACSANGLMDIGNFLRFSDESPVASETWFADAYRAAGGTLAPDWRTRSLIMDLSAQLSFLMSEDELSRTFATALGVVDRTLARLG